MSKALLKLIVAMSVLLVSCGAGVEPNQDWPMSGVSPQGNRVIASLQEEKTPKSDILAWMYTASGEYPSTPAVTVGKLYVGTEDNKMLCLDAGNGQLVWQSEMISKAHGTPCVADGVVCQPTEDGHVYCFDVLSGKQKWARTIDESVYIEATVDDQKLYVPAGKNLYCLDVENGTIIWKTLFETEYFDLVSTDSDRIYCSNSKDLVCLDASNGIILWTNKQENGHYASPVIYKGSLYACLSIEDEKTKYADDKKKGSFLCLNPRTGETIWSVEFENEGKDIVLYEKYACINTNWDGKYICIDIDEKKVTWTYDSENSYCAPPFVYDGKFYLTSGRRTSSFEPSTGKVIKTHLVKFGSVMVNDKFYFIRDEDQKQMVCIDSDSDVETGMLDYVSDANPQIIKRDNKLRLGVRDNSKIYAFVNDKVKWETPTEWSVVATEYPGKKNAYFWENGDKVVVLHGDTYSCLDRATGKELWNFKTGAAKLVFIDGYIMNFLEGGMKEITLNIIDGTTKVKKIVTGDDVVVYEGDISEELFFRDKSVSVIKPGVYMISTNSGGVHGPDSFHYYICSLNGQTCTIKSPGERGKTEYSKLQNLKDKYYFTFNYKEFMGDDIHKAFTKAFEADTETGLTKEIKLNEIPTNAQVLENKNKDEYINDKRLSSIVNPEKVSEDDIAKKTGIKKHPEKISEYEEYGSYIDGCINGQFIIVSRKNFSGGSDLSYSYYDLLAVFEKESWKKIWETGGCESYHVIGSLIFVERGDILNIATGKSVSAYSDIKLIGELSDMIFLFAKKDGKTKIVVMNLKKIDELKNLEPPKQEGQ